MTADAFQAACIALLRSTLGWQSAMARQLGVDRRVVTRWMQAGETPAWVDTRLAELMGMRDPAPWPRDEWVIGDAVTADGRRREYVIHLATPRFAARIVSCDALGLPEPGEEPADLVSGTVYAIDDGTVLCEVDWIDKPPAGQVTHLLEAAAAAIDVQTARDAG